MYLPDMQYEIAPGKKKILEFRGYSNNAVIDDGEMRDMYNLSSDEYPCLYQRKQRGIFSKEYKNPTAILAKRDKLAVISNGKFFYDNIEIPGFSLSAETRMVAINTRICFFPEKMLYNVETGKVWNMGVDFTATGSITITTKSVKVTGIPENLNEGDAIEISGCTVNLSNNVSAVIKALDRTTGLITFPEDTFVVASGDSYVEPSIKMDRKVPDLEFVMESNNRLWGCKDNTIYACKLGDPTNWYYNQNTSLDSYAVEVGSDGAWTGCSPYSAHLLFFKEGCIHKVYGNKPSAYQIVDVKCHGLQEGCNKSVQSINETVFYKSRVGVMAYAGGTPELVSECFGRTRYRNAVAGTDGTKYYISMESDSGWRLFVFDITKGLWHIEDDTQALDFSYCGGELYYIDQETKAIMSVTGNLTERIEWSCVLGEFDEYVEEKKIYSKFQMRLQLAEQSEISISIKTDSGDWIDVFFLYAEERRSVYVPIIPMRCDKFQIKLSGKGYCKIESVVREYREGSGV